MLKKAIIWALVLYAGVVVKAEGGAATRPAWTDKVVRVHKILHIQPEAGRTYFVELNNALHSRPPRPTESNTPVDVLASALCRGIEADGFASQLIALTTLKEVGVRKEFGTTGDRLNMARIMLQRAKSLRGVKDPEVIVLSRGALLLGLYEDFMLGKVMVQMVTAEWDEYVILAGLDKAQAAALKEVLDEIAKDTKWQEHFRKYVRLEAALIEDAEKAMPPDKFAAALDALRQEYKDVENIGDKYLTIVDAWMLRNLAISRKNEVAVKAIDDMLIEWTNVSPAEPLGRWLREARTEIAEPFSNSRIIGPGAKRR